MGARPIRRKDGDGVSWVLDLQHHADGVWGYWIAVGPDDFPTGYDGSAWAPDLDWTDPTLLDEVVLEVPAPGYCPVCDSWCFLDGTVRHASHCSQRYWYLTYQEDQGHARRGKAKTDKELLRDFKQAGLKSTYAWQVEAPRLGLSNWSTYDRRFRDDKRRRGDETTFAFVRRISARIR